MLKKPTFNGVYSVENPHPPTLNQNVLCVCIIPLTSQPIRQRHGWKQPSELTNGGCYRLHEEIQKNDFHWPLVHNILYKRGFLKKHYFSSILICRGKRVSCYPKGVSRRRGEKAIWQRCLICCAWGGRWSGSGLGMNHSVGGRVYWAKRQRLENGGVLCFVGEIKMLSHDLKWEPGEMKGVIYSNIIHHFSLIRVRTC